MAESSDPQLEWLLTFLRDHRGFDFTGYKRATLTRRIARRMSQLEIDSYADYADYLQVRPDEFTTLFNTVLINVTTFFRDVAAWQRLRETALDGLADSKPEQEPLRIWSAGCASGEEPYTLAMMIAETAGIDVLRDRVKIYATDIDEEALAKARSGAYSEAEVRDIPAELRERYLEQDGNRFRFIRDIRRAVIFGRHNIVIDAPISRVDVLTCRNTLMYFNAETQAQILRRFHFALHDTGYLFLGKVEMLLTHGDLFTPADPKSRIFQKVPSAHLRDRLLVLADGATEPAERIRTDVRIVETAFDGSPLPQLVVDAAGFLVHANRAARRMFDLRPSDAGRPFQDLAVSYRPAELRVSIDRVRDDQVNVVLHGVPHETGADVQTLDIHVTPLGGLQGTHAGVNIAFVDVTEHRRLKDELQHANRQLESAYEELQSTNEELETTNEELQSTVEELETTNEELQSTNEELETMNEELQSTNDALRTINDELQSRTGDLDEVNAFLESMLSSMHGGLAVIDRDTKVVVWNAGIEDLWGLRQSETTGRPFGELDFGLDLGAVLPALQQCIQGKVHESHQELPAVTRRGKQITCRVTTTPLRSRDGSIRGAILMMEDVTPDRSAADV